MVDHRFQITQNYKLCLRPIPVRFFFLFDSIWVFQPIVRRRRTPVKLRSRPCASQNEFTYSPRDYPMQKSACPSAQLEILPTGQNLILKIEVAPNKNENHFRTRDVFTLFFVGLCTVGHNSIYASEEAEF